MTSASPSPANIEPTNIIANDLTSAMLAFLVFVGCFIAAFALRSVTRVWGVLAGVGAAMLGAAWLLSRALS